MALERYIFVYLAVAVCSQSAVLAETLGFNSLPGPVRIIPSPEPVQYLNPYSTGPEVEEAYGPSNYQFNYHISDPHTGDVKSQQEEFINNALRGSYSFVQPDGLLRIVEYFDDGTGFNAHVRYEPSSLSNPPSPARIPILVTKTATPRLVGPITSGLSTSLVAHRIAGGLSTPLGAHRIAGGLPTPFIAHRIAGGLPTPFVAHRINELLP